MLAIRSCARFNTKRLQVGAAAATCAALYTTLPETLPKRREQAAGGVDNGMSVADVSMTVGQDDAAPPKPVSFVELVRSDRRLAGLLVMDSAVFVGWGVWLAVVPLHAVAVWDASPAMLGAMFSVMSIAAAIGAPLGGLISDRVGRNATIIGGACCCAISTLLLPTTTSMITFGAYLAVWDFGEGVLAAALSALAADAAKTGVRAQVFALRAQVESGVMLVAPVAVGALADATSLGTSLYLSSATMTAAIVGFGLLARSKVRRRKQL